MPSSTSIDKKRASKSSPVADNFDSDIVDSRVLRDLYWKQSDHLIAMGKLTVNFSYLELSLKSLFCLMAGKDDVLADVVTSQIGFDKLLTCCKSLYEARVNNERRLSNARRVLSLASTLNEIRNRYIHSIWLPPTPSTSIMRYKVTARFRSGLKRQLENLDIKELYATADQFLDCADSVLQLAIEFGNKASKRRPPNNP